MSFDARPKKQKDYYINPVMKCFTHPPLAGWCCCGAVPSGGECQDGSDRITKTLKIDNKKALAAFVFIGQSFRSWRLDLAVLVELNFDNNKK